MANPKTESDPSRKSNKKKKKTKSLLSAPAAAAMKGTKRPQQQPKDNPFEVIWSRKKFDVLGKKRKGEERRLGLARSQAILKRKKTLQQEYEQSAKSSVFIDKRIGEKDDTLQEFDKAVLRLQRERQVHKTKEQVMSEIILKNKFYKAQKAKDKEEDDHLAEKLDHDFTSLAQNKALLSLTQPSKMNSLKALANKSNVGQSSKGPCSSADKESFKKEKPDAYDKLVKEMSLDMRARPSDRTKTPEEIAQEEKERLESLEEERLKRMVASGDSSGEDSSDGEDLNSGSKKFKAVSGDGLGVSFSVDEEITNKKGWIDDIYEKEVAGNQDEGSTSSEGSESDDDDQEGSDGEDDSDDDDTTGNEHGNMSMKDWEQSDDDELGLDAEHADDADEVELDKKNMDTENMEPISCNKSSSTGKQAPPKQEALPFVIEAPNTMEELCSLLDDRSDEEVIEAITRIRTCNAIRLNPEKNRRKIQYFLVTGTQRPLNVKRLNSFVKPLMEIVLEIPFFAARRAHEHLIVIRRRFCEDIKIPEKSSWPSVKTLLLLRLLLLTFPCSDFRHPVMTPAILLMCEYLIRCPIIYGRDVAVGSFLCSMVLSVAKQSQKFCPEAIIFVQTLLMSSFELEPRLQPNSQGHHLMELKTSKPWLLIQDHTIEVHPIDFFMVIHMDVDSPIFLTDNFKASILVSLVETLKGFAQIYEKLSSFPEIFLPLSDLLHEMLQKANLPSLLQGNVRHVIDLIKTKSDEHQMPRQPLQIRKRKPVPIKLLNPKFEESFVKGRDYDPDRERAEREKAKKLLKSEAKGAVRELRKDNHFIFGLKERDRLLQEEERAEKYGKAMAFLQEQEHAFKSGQLGKKR